MNFKSGKTYRHKNTLDTDMFVLSAEEGARVIKLTVRYINRSGSLLNSKTDWVEVKKTDIENWKCLS